MNTDYTLFGAIDLAIDESFLRHHLAPSPESEHFWNNWLLENPGKCTEWEEACKLVDAVRLGLTDYTRTYLSEEAEELLLQRIWQTNHVTEGPQPLVIPSSIWNRSRMAAAAILLTLTAIGGYWLTQKYATTDTMYQTQVSKLHNTQIEQINDGQVPKPFYLPDSSYVLLYPSSKISYSSTYERDDRNVYLTGQAQFDVRKNPKKPFRVFANEIITKVLGTRFEVRAFETGKDIIVKVLSGQVSVYQEKELNLESRSEKAGVLLLPNQQVIFKRENEQFNKVLVEKPSLLTPTSPEQFVYDEKPVNHVLADIETAYGVDIVFSQELLQACELTANLTEESLRGKLDIICRSIGATYEIVEAQIIITTKGCRNTKS